MADPHPSRSPSALLLGLLCLAIAGLGPASASALSLSIGTRRGQAVFDEGDLGCATPAADGSFDCGSGTYAGAGWTLGVDDLFLDPDPTILGAFSVTNLTAMPVVFTALITMPVAPLSSPVSITGSVGVTLTDGGGGASLSTSGGLSLYRAQIDGSTVRTLLDDPFSISAPNLGSNTTSVAFGPEFLASAVTTDIGILLHFQLSPGDAAAFTAVFNVVPVPEPGTALLLVGGLLGLAAFGRRRKDA
jgi:PEP-CTERM motif